MNLNKIRKNQLTYAMQDDILSLEFRTQQEWEQIFASGEINFQEIKEVLKCGNIIKCLEMAKAISNACKDDVLKARLLKRIEQNILSSGSLFACYQLARDVEGVDVERLQDAVLENKHLNYDYLVPFAKDVKGADVKRIEQEIIERENALFALNFAIEIPNANVAELENIVVKSKNLEYILNFAKDVNGANIERLQSIIEHTFNPYFCLQFAKYVKGADVPSLVEVIVNSGEIEICLQALTELKISEISKEMLIFAIMAKSEDSSLVSLRLDVEDALSKNKQTKYH